MEIQQLVGLSLLPPSVLGFVCNWIIVIVVVRHRALHRPFAILTANLAACYAAASTAGLLLMCPMIILDEAFLKENSMVSGSVFLLTYEITAQTHLVISIDRFVAVVFPLSYKTVFTLRTVKKSIFLMITVSTITTVTFLIVVDCRFAYDNNQWKYRVLGHPRCVVLAWSMFFMKNVMFSFIDIVLHIITFHRVYNLKKSAIRAAQSSPRHTTHESYFLKQTFGQTALKLIELLAYPFYSNKIPVYICFLFSTFLWCSIHAAEGVITLIYNSEIRQRIRKKQKTFGNLNAKVSQPEN